MRILLTVPSLAREFGGPAVKTLRMAEALRAHGHQVAVVGCGEAGGGVGLPTFGRFHSTPVPRRLAPLTRLARRADIVHVVGYRDPVGTAAALVASRAQVPVVLEPVGMLRPRSRSRSLKLMFDSTIGRKVVASATSIVATSRRERAELISCEVAPDRIRVRPNGIDVDELLPLPVPGAFRSALGIGDQPLVLAVARICSTKGLSQLVTAMAELPDAECVIAGPDERDGTLQELERLRRELDLGERLHVLVGGLWGREKAQALADADCFCMPSELESFGQGAAEAASVGLPVVLSSGCGVVEWLDAAASRVFTYGDIAGLSSALRDATGRSEARAAAVAAAPSTRRMLGWEEIAAAQERIYESARG